MWLIKNVLSIKNWVSFYRGSLHLELRNGLKVDLPSRHDLPMVYEVMTDRVYGDLSLLPDNAVILDLGANLGSFALLALKTLPLAKIYSYEGASRTAKILSQNIRQNGFSGRGFPHHLAVSDKAGLAIFTLVGSGNTGHNYLKGAYDDNEYYDDTKTESVECATLDQILEKTGIADFVKMDIEGAEYKVLYASKLFPTHVKKLAMEYHGSLQQAEDLASYFKQIGFEVTGPVTGKIYATKNLRQ